MIFFFFFLNPLDMSLLYPARYKNQGTICSACTALHMPSKASETPVGSPSFSLQSSELQCSNGWAGWEEATFPHPYYFFFPWAKTLLSSCLQAVSWQPVRSNFCLFHPRENRSSLARAASEEGISCGTLCSPTERKQTKEHLHWDLWT